MKAPLFIRNKILRALNENGCDYEFILKTVDEYNQPIDGETLTIRGIYHEQNSFITIASNDSASVQRKKNPMILCLFEDANAIKQGDKVVIDGIVHRVSGVLNIQNYGIAADISLEMEV